MSSETATLPPSSNPPGTPAPRSFKLPNPRHAARIPVEIAPADLARIQQAAYQLPQVVKPADYLDEHAPNFEQHLDTLGMILLQKAVPGARRRAP
jgi:ATP-dependent RNA helicase SUPV3L1/SUV3